MINIIQIKDLDAPELQIYYNLNEAQLFHYFEPKPGIFIAESPKVIERALDAGCVPMSFLMEKKIMKIKSCVISGQRNLKENICRFFTERKYISGITVIELVLILVIVIALLLIFKTELINLINSIFDKITSESSGI